MNLIQKSPADWGVRMPNGWIGGLPDDFILGVDETPLQYTPSANGTYVTGNESNTFIAGDCDRRQATGTPCTTKSGELAVCQLIWRGKTTMCLPSLSEDLKARAAELGIYSDFAEKKCQNRRTWWTVMQKSASGPRKEEF